MFPREKTPLEEERERICHWDGVIDRFLKNDPHRATELIMREWHFATEQDRSSMVAALIGMVSVNAMRSK